MPEDRSVLTRAARPPTRQWRYGPHDDHIADVYEPAVDMPDADEAGGAGEPRPTILLIHGGFWRPQYDRVHLRPLAAALADRGHLVVSVDYRRTPGSPDHAVDDVRLALDGMEEFERREAARGIQLVGHSAGGHLALLVAATSRRAADSCLALAPVADLAEAERLDLDSGAVTDFLGGPAASRPDLDPARLPAPSVPVRILHGDDDAIVPLPVARSYVEAIGAPPGVVLSIAPAVGHFALIDPDGAAWTMVLQELDALLDDSPAP